MSLRRKIVERRGGILLYALTPPRSTTPPERVREIAAATARRLEGVDLDGLVLYDIDDESDRNPEERPFPFLPTMDPADFRSDHLGDLPVPAVVYRAVRKYSEDELGSWLEGQDPDRTLSVLVGGSSRDSTMRTTLRRAQELRSAVAPDLLLGGVTIPERHRRSGDEHERLVRKQRAGCSFFVTQVVFDTDAAKDLVSDYHFGCAARGVPTVPIVFTLTVCGSLKTLRFLSWLGVDVPRWLQNDLRHADDTLAVSLAHAAATARELAAFCRRLGVPFGFNVESVSIRRAEIDASVELLTRVGPELELHPDDPANRRHGGPV